jgi:hypothetical protein
MCKVHGVIHDEFIFFLFNFGIIIKLIELLNYYRDETYYSFIELFIFQNSSPGYKEMSLFISVLFFHRKSFLFYGPLLKLPELFLSSHL